MVPDASVHKMYHHPLQFAFIGESFSYAIEHPRPIDKREKNISISKSGMNPFLQWPFGPNQTFIIQGHLIERVCVEVILDDSTFFGIKYAAALIFADPYDPPQRKYFPLATMTALDAGIINAFGTS